MSGIKGKQKIEEITSEWWAGDFKLVTRGERL